MQGTTPNKYYGGPKAALATWHRWDMTESFFFFYEAVRGGGEVNWEKTAYS